MREEEKKRLSDGGQMREEPLPQEEQLHCPALSILSLIKDENNEMQLNIVKHTPLMNMWWHKAISVKWGDAGGVQQATEIRDRTSLCSQGRAGGLMPVSSEVLFSMRSLLKLILKR